MKKSIQGQTLILSITEGLTANKIASYNEELDKIAPTFSEFNELLLDLEQTNNIDSTGVTFVIGLFKKAKALGLNFCVIGANSDVQSLFKLMKLDQFFELKNQ